MTWEKISSIGAGPAPRGALSPDAAKRRRDPSSLGQGISQRNGAWVAGAEPSQLLEQYSRLARLAVSERARPRLQRSLDTIQASLNALEASQHALHLLAARTADAQASRCRSEPGGAGFFVDRNPGAWSRLPAQRRGADAASIAATDVANIAATDVATSAANSAGTGEASTGERPGASVCADAVADRCSTLAAAICHVGLEQEELYWDYLALGGNCSLTSFSSYLLGEASLSRRDYDIFVQALNERFIDLGFHFPVPYWQPAPAGSL